MNNTNGDDFLFLQPGRSGINPPLLVANSTVAITTSNAKRKSVDESNANFNHNSENNSNNAGDTSTASAAGPGKSLMSCVRKWEENSRAMATITVDSMLESNGHNDDNDDLFEQLQTLISNVSRQGLMQNHQELAKEFTKTLHEQDLADSSGDGRSNNNGNKRSQKRHKNGSEGNIFHKNTTGNSRQNDPSTSVFANLDSFQILLAVSRLLVVCCEIMETYNNKNNNSTATGSTVVVDDGNKVAQFYILTGMASDLITAASEFVQQQSLSSANHCAIVEYQMLSSIAYVNVLLTNYEKSLRQIIKLEQASLLPLSSTDVSSICKFSLLRSSASILNLMTMVVDGRLTFSSSPRQTFCYRFPTLLKNLESLAWEMLLTTGTVYNDSSTGTSIENDCGSSCSVNCVSQAAAQVLMALARIGINSSSSNNSSDDNNGSGNGNVSRSLNTPGQAWMSMIHVAEWVLIYIIREIAGEKLSPEKRFRELCDGPINSAIDKVVKDKVTMIKIKNIRNEQGLCVNFLQVCQGVVNLLVALLNRDGNSTEPSTAWSSFIDATFDLASFYTSIIELMLEFSVSCESVYFTTRKRLRSEPTHSGVLSPYTLASQAANPIKSLGHVLLDAFLQSVSPPLLLPHSKRLYLIVYMSLRVTMSATLKTVIDSNVGGHSDNDNKKSLTVVSDKLQQQRWLYRSVTMRTIAVNSVSAAVRALGVNSSHKEGNTARQTKQNANREQVPGMIKIACGLLVEELSFNDAKSGGDNGNDSWGSLSERAELADACVRCLVACLQSHGEYMPLKCRNLIESTAVTVINQLSVTTAASFQNHHLLRSTTYIISVLDLGTACVSTPWPDGSKSLLAIDDSSVVVTTACILCHNTDNNIAAAARRCLQICNVSSVSRVPALLIVKRSVGHDTWIPINTSIGATNCNDIEFGSAFSLSNEISKVKQDAEIRQKEEKEKVYRKEQAKNERENNVKSAVDSNNDGATPEATKNGPIKDALTLQNISQAETPNFVRLEDVSIGNKGKQNLDEIIEEQRNLLNNSETNIETEDKVQAKNSSTSGDGLGAGVETSNDAESNADHSMDGDDFPEIIESAPDADDQ